MSRHAAFLRGMNIGGRRLTNEQLRACFAESGFAEVGTFRASGNVVFTVEDDEAEASLVARIEGGLAASLGYAVPTFIRPERELRAIAANRPFAAELLAASAGKLQVAMLAAPPSPAVRGEVLALAGEEDLLVFGRRELFWLPSGGLLDSPLDLKAIARLLGPMTIRTKGTIEQLAGKHFP